MVSQEVLRQIVLQQKDQVATGGAFVRREILPSILEAFGDNRVIVLSGIRRCGKSTLLRQVMEATGRYCYVNFEDERLLSFRAEEFEILHEVLIEVYGVPDTYFFDEVQNVGQFETFVRRLQDSGKKVVITGSNASLMSQEFGTRLTGRYKLFEIYPFSFAEFLAFSGIVHDRDAGYFPETKVRLLSALSGYAERGGMPEYLKNRDPEYIKTLYDNILYRDIITRYAVRRHRVVRELVGILSSSVSRPFTYNSLKKSLGLKNAITAKEYITYLSGAYLFFELLRFDRSLKRQLGAPRKIYVIDTAFALMTGFSLSPDKGRVLENMVYIELRRRGAEVWYYADMKNAHECDFVTKQGNRMTGAFQVCYELTGENEGREVAGLVAAMTDLGLKQGFILTNDMEDRRVVGDMTIVVQPVWRWLLSRDPR
jgi:predicted AAA+ superfamily ATPase